VPGVDQPKQPGLLRLLPEYYLANWASLAGSPVDGWTL
jgi:hypothetical protein